MKQALSLFLLLALCFTAIACTKQETLPADGDADENSTTDAPSQNAIDAMAETKVDETALLYDYDLSAYITLPDYMGIKLKKSDVTASQEQIDAQIKSDFLGKDVSRAVQTGDVAIIDFVGKRDGIAFQGGTGYDYELEIGSHSFIDGFEEGLVGVMPGETVDLNLTFPEDYQNEELRGVAVVFTTTVKYIKTDSTELPVLTDAIVKILTDYETVAEYNSEMPKKLSETLLKNAVQKYLFENAVIHSFPENALAAHRTNYVKDVAAMLAAYGMKISEYLPQVGMTEDEFLSRAEEYAKSAVESDLVLYAVSREQNITVSEEQRAKALEEIFLEYQKEYSIANMDSLAELLAEDADKLILQRVIVDLLCEHAVLED